MPVLLRVTLCALLVGAGPLVGAAEVGDNGTAADVPAVSGGIKPLAMSLRRRVGEPSAGGGLQFVVVASQAQWDPAKTALIICDMWDDHWCHGAAQRVAELAGPMNQFVHRLRDQGVFILHCPSTCVDFYRDTPQRQRALAAPAVKLSASLSEATRWGTKWYYPDPRHEPELPIDDTDMGCDCPTPCEIRSAWTRQIATIDIVEPDAISDDGQEVCNLLAERGIDHVLIVGVHLNMCVLGRSFAIRQLTALGKNVVLVRDLTDTMYNHRRKPLVDHFSGTDLVVEHVEKYFCPTTSSADLIGGTAFRFQADPRR